jgi:hypothetical protein
MPVTFTEKLQDELAAREPFDQLTVPEPGLAVIVPVVHVPDKPLLGLATVNPAGRLSVNEMLLRPVSVLELPMLKVKLVLVLRFKLDVPKDLLNVGGVGTTKVAL